MYLGTYLRYDPNDMSFSKLRQVIIDCGRFHLTSVSLHGLFIKASRKDTCVRYIVAGNITHGSVKLCRNSGSDGTSPEDNVLGACVIMFEASRVCELPVEWCLSRLVRTCVPSHAPASRILRNAISCSDEFNVVDLVPSLLNYSKLVFLH